MCVYLHPFSMCAVYIFALKPIPPFLGISLSQLAFCFLGFGNAVLPTAKYF